MEKLKDKPFALIGVNILRHTPASLKKVMAKEKINWRTFADQGDITRQWNSPGTPSFYLLDAQGVIRRKWVGHPGERVIDLALQKLLKEMEDSKSPK